MIRIEEFTTAGLLAMGSEEIERQVKLECAMDGVKILPMPIKPLPKVIDKKDFYFELTGTGLKSRDADALERIRTAVEAERQVLIKTDYSYKHGFSDYFVTGPNTTVSVVDRTICFLEKDLADNEAMLANQKKARDQYDAHKKEYDAENKRVEQIRDNILQRVYDAREFQDQVHSLTHTFGEYVELAEGNEDRALQFFDKAYKNLDPKKREAVVGHLLVRAAAPEEAQARH